MNKEREYQRKYGNDAKILILDNHDDIGGHAKRNEFKSGDKTLLGYGGTQSIVSAYPPETIGDLSEIGIELRRFNKYWDRDFRSSPNIVGRRRFGRITIANSDAGAQAETGAAIEQALRAVSELPA